MSTTDIDVAGTLREIAAELDGIFYERKPLIRALMLGLLSRHHVYALGAVGTGKTDTIREMVRRLVGCRYFETIMSRTRSDAAVLGPYDLPRLATTGEFVRRNRGYLTDVDVPFIDEIGKMGATLGHDILGALNERQMHQVEEHPDGTVTTVRPIPLHSAFTASNETLGTEDDVQALWDRLLIRVQVEYIKEPGTFSSFLAAAVGDADRHEPKVTLPYEAVVDVARNVVPYIPLPRAVNEAMVEIARAMRENGIVLSDRRWRQTVRVMQAQAYLDGRKAITMRDLTVLDFTGWQEPGQLSVVQRVRADVADPLAKEVLEIKDRLKEIRKVIGEQEGKAISTKAGVGVENTTKLDIVMRDELPPLRMKYNNRDGDAAPVDSLATEIGDLHRMISRICLEQADLEDL